MSNNAASLLRGTRRDGIPFIVSAPSGAGKTTLCRRAQAELGDIRFSVSHTTRPMRGQEHHGRDYYFVSEQEFRRMIHAGAFAEWAEYNGNLYGTSLEELERARKGGEDLFVEIEVQGAMQLMPKLPEAVFIFVLPPSLAILEQRLRGRGTDSEDAIQRRLTIALREIEYQDKYHYIVVNDNLDRSLALLTGIVRAERARTERLS